MEHKRASSGFVGTTIGAVMTVIQSTHPEWFGNHPWVLPVSLLILLASLLFWLTQYGWFQALLGVGQRATHAAPPITPPPPATPAPAPLTPEEVRETILALVSDLCGYLHHNGHRVDVPTPTPYDNMAMGGLGKRRSEPEIRDSFVARFETRILQAKELIGGFGLLDTHAGFTSVGDVLSMSAGVWNASDVRELIVALDNAADAISVKYLHGFGFRLVAPPVIEVPALPTLDGEIFRIFRAEKTVNSHLVRQLWEGLNPGKEYPADTDILVEMYVVNTSSGPQYVRDFQGSVEIDGQRVPLVREQDFFAFDVGDGPFEYCLDASPTPNEVPIITDGPSASLPALFHVLPTSLAPSQPAEGWTRFVLKGRDPEKLHENRTYKFVLKDSLGKEFEISRVANPQRTTPPVKARKRSVN